MLANALGAGLGLPLDVVRRSAAAAGVDPTRRAETLTLSEFAALATGLPERAPARLASFIQRFPAIRRGESAHRAGYQT